MWKHYLQPNSIENILHLLDEKSSHTAIIAGGTDLILDIRQGRHAPVVNIIDITNVPDLKEIKLTEEQIFLGATVTLAEIVQDGTLKKHAQCLVESCGLIGGPQVRNEATIGGNVAHALPAGDGIIALLALGAEVQIASLKGRRWQPLENLFISPGEITLDRNSEIIVSFRFPTRKAGEGSVFKRVMRPQGVAIAILNIAIWLQTGENQYIKDIKIAVGPAGPRPLRAKKTENLLKGLQLDAIEFQQAYEVLDNEVQLRTSPHRATAEYRHHLLPFLFKQVFESAVRRANQNEGEMQNE